MVMMLQLIFVLSTLISITESSDVVRVVGDAVQLDIKNTVPEFNELIWVFNEINNVLKYDSDSKTYKQYPDYKDRVEFNDETYSLTLKNLQTTDSGLYEARASGDEDTVVVAYRLFVSSDVVRSFEGSIQLDIQLSVPKFDELIWVFNEINNVLKYDYDTKISKQYPDYEDRVEFNDESYSLTLKNLQEGDSGLYEAKASDEDKVIAKYRLTVSGSVSPTAGVCFLKTVLYSIILTVMMYHLF